VPDNTLSSVRLYEQLAQRIKGLIIAGELKAGDRLPNERQLADQYGVSRTVVREAVKALKQEGLVEVRAGIGTFVIDSTSQAVTQSLELMMTLGQKGELRNIVEIREILEPEIAYLAAIRATPTEIERMERALRLMDENMGDIQNYTKEDHSFHLALAQATQNVIIPRLMSSIVDLLQTLRERIALTPGARDRGQQHHRNILEAVREHDPTAARQAMKAHLKQVRDDSGMAGIGVYEEKPQED